MIKNFIFVEDGSVDVDEVQDVLDETTKIIVYRQGSKPPEIIQPNPINCFMDSVYIKQQKQLSTVKTELEKAFQFKMSKKLHKLLDQLYTDIFC